MKALIITIFVMVVALFGYHQVNSMEKNMEEHMEKQSQLMAQHAKTIVLAGGCFWCVESDFEKVAGVSEAVSGYTGGNTVNPAYKAVSAGGTGHVEAVKITYDPTRISFENLLDVFWRHIDPTDPGGQFVDRGAQYRSVIFYANEEEKHMAETSKKRMGDSGRFSEPIVTEILPLKTFYPAEMYHQDYYKKNPIRYKWYRSGSGRDKFLKKTWAGKPDTMKHNMGEMAAPMSSDMSSATGMSAGENKMSNAGYLIPDNMQLKRRLTPIQYKVTRKNGTERPFDNMYWNNHEEGIYVDIISGEPLFNSMDKFESGTGWPSFTRPLVPNNIVGKTDRGLFMVRTEVRSKHADSHLGHVFKDGPDPTGLRYCINSAALRFIAKADLEKEGYGKFKTLFN